MDLQPILAHLVQNVAHAVLIALFVASFALLIGGLLGRR